MYAVLMFALLAAFAQIVFTWARAWHLGRLARLRQLNSPLRQATPSASVTILIPAWKESGTIEKCVESLQRQTYQEWAAVVVAGGPDKTFEVAEQLALQDSRLQVIRQAPRGKNAALAEAFEVADGEILVILDADSVLEPSWLAIMLDTLGQGYTAVCGNYFPLRDTWVSRSEQMEKVSSYMVHQRVTLQGSGSIAVSRESLNMSGGFPPEVTVGVDWDLDTRLKGLGLKVGFAQGAKVFTQRPATLGEFWRNETRWRRAHLAAIARHRRFHMSNPLLGLQQVSFYLVALAVLAALIGLMASTVEWHTTGQYHLFALFLLFLLWIAGRRAALAVEVAAFVKSWDPVSRFWAPVVLLFVAFAASLTALMTSGKQPVQFRGPRQATSKRE